MSEATTVAGGDIGDRLAFRNILRLALAQALAGANASIIFATGGIVGSTLAPDASLSTLPISVFVVGMAASTLPIGYIARHYGRRASFLTGSGFGVLGGLCSAFAILHALFGLFCFGAFCCGVYAAVVQSFRFAATDGVSSALRPRAISWVMAGGVFAGVLGPQLVQLTMDAWAPFLFSASFLAQAVVAALAMAVLAGIDMPRPQSANLPSGRPLSVIARQPRFIVAVLCGLVTYGLMNLIMTSAPLAMRLCGLTLTDSNLAIQWHVIAMYGPSFFTGGLIARFGAPRIVAGGLALLVIAAAIHLSGLTVAHFWIGLIVLGVGWNFGFIGASAMIVELHRPEERNKVQAFNDFVIFGTMMVGSFSSGQMLANSGWALVNDVVFLPVGLALIALIVVSRLQRPTLAT